MNNAASYSFGSRSKSKSKSKNLNLMAVCRSLPQKGYVPIEAISAEATFSEESDNEFRTNVSKALIKNSGN